MLYVARDEVYTDYLYQALTQKGMEIILLNDPSRIPTRDGSSFPMSLSEMQNYSTVIFNDIPAYSLSMAQMKMIKSYVHDLGGGFVMIGGENSFGSGGYHETPIEDVLPVKMVPERKKRSLSIVLAIDRSGSMAIPSGRYVKIDLAKEAAVSVAEFLTDKDQIGVIAFDAEAEEVVRLSKVKSKGNIEDRISKIQARGGTNIYPALEIAHRRLKDADTQLKHVILVSDGRSQQPNDSYTLVREMAQDKITVSTIAIGGDADREAMQDIADLGLGRYYETDDAGSLPRIFVKEAFVASKLIMEGDFRPAVAEDSEILKGISGWGDRETRRRGDTETRGQGDNRPIAASPRRPVSLLPPLRGYVGTSPKDGASVLIVSDTGELAADDPILSVWRYGLGRTLAFTSDAKPKWAVEWLKWSDFSKFWSQAIGWSLAIPSGEFNASANIVGSVGHVTVDAVDSKGRFRNFLDFQANVVKPDLSNERLPLRQSGPGRYEAEFDAGQMGTYLLNVSEMKDGKAIDSQNTGAVASYSPEYKDLKPNYSLLERLAVDTGGKFRPEIGEIATHSKASVWQLQDLWRFLVLASIPLFFLDVALRRITISKEQISELRSKLYLSKSDRTPTTAVGTLVNLRRRKEGIWGISKTQDTKDDTASSHIPVSPRPFTPPSQTPPSSSSKPISTVKSEEAYTSRLLEAKRRAEQNKR